METYTRNFTILIDFFSWGKNIFKFLISEFFLGWGERGGLDKFVTHFLGFQYLDKMQVLQVFTERMLLFLYRLITYINNRKNEFWTKISNLTRHQY